MKQTPQQQLTTLAAEVVRVLEQRATEGCQQRTWKGFENGNGVEVGTAIDRLIRRAKRILEQAPDTS